MATRTTQAPAERVSDEVIVAQNRARGQVYFASARAAELQWLAMTNRTAARELEEDAEIRARAAAAGGDVDAAIGDLRSCARTLDVQAQAYRQQARAIADDAGIDVPEDEIDPVPF